MGFLGGGGGGEREGGDGISSLLTIGRRAVGGVDRVRLSFGLEGGGGSGLFVVGASSVGMAGNGLFF